MWTGGKIVQQEIIEILCDDSTSCKEAGDNNDYHRSRQQQTFNMSVVESLSLLYLLFISRFICSRR